MFIVNAMSAVQSIEKLCTIFVTHGLSITLVLNNWPPFSSAVMASNIDECPFITNQLAENMVKSLEQTLNKTSKSDSMKTNVSKFLITYKVTKPFIITITPCKLQYCMLLAFLLLDKLRLRVY